MSSGYFLENYSNYFGLQAGGKGGKPQKKWRRKGININNRSKKTNRSKKGQKNRSRRTKTNVKTLVVCSCETRNWSKSSDYQKQKDAIQIILGGDLGTITWMSSHCPNKKQNGWFPEDVKDKYDNVWFAGCDHIPTWDMGAVKKGGKIIFTTARPEHQLDFKTDNLISLGEKKGYILKLDSYVSDFYNRLQNELNYVDDEYNSVEEKQADYDLQQKWAEEIKKNYVWRKEGYYEQKDSLTGNDLGSEEQMSIYGSRSES